VTVAVVGAGVAGLTAAYDLVRAGAAVTRYESERRAGGLVITERRDGFITEGGPDGFLASEPEIPELAADLAGGLSQRLVSPPAGAGASVWAGGRFTPLPQGAAADLLGIPVSRSVLAAGFRSFAGGMADLTEGLVAALRDRVRTGCGVTGLSPAGSGWRLSITGGSAHECQAVVLALPAGAAARLLETAGVTTARALGEVFYQPSLHASLAYKADQVRGDLAGTGFIVGESDGGVLRACTFASRKFPGRAPAGFVLLRAFLDADQEVPDRAAHDALAPILRITGAPQWVRVFFWPRGLPRYPAHHVAAVADVRRRLERLPPLAIAGAGFDGRGVSACVRSGRAAARRILEG
jgi:protoporphyrinogen oxidase